MRLTGISRAAACLAVGCTGMLAATTALRAQTTFSLGGGWNYLAPAPGSVFPIAMEFSRGYNFQASVGRVVAPRVRLRLDGSVLEFNRTTRLNGPVLLILCPAPGCGPMEARASANVVALTANTVVDVDPREIGRAHV